MTNNGFDLIETIYQHGYNLSQILLFPKVHRFEADQSINYKELVNVLQMISFNGKLVLPMN